jgi:hypothetical protein
MVPVLRRLEAGGLVRRRHGQYQLTRRGRDELELTRSLVRLVVRADYRAARSTTAASFART